LYLSYPGSLSTESGIRLNKLKELARSDIPKQAALAQYEAIDHLFEVSPRGSHPFSYVLTDNWYYLRIARHRAITLPLAHARIASGVLWLHGPRKAETTLRRVVETFGQVEHTPTVSRVDICVDFCTDYPLHLIRDQDWITRAKTIDRYSVSRKFTGFSIGFGGVLLARLYNKTLEIEKSGKTFFHDIWAKYGWQPGETVWRLEFQFRRAVLKELGVNTFDELDEALDGLWSYATGSWLRLADPASTIKKRADLPNHPLWDELHVADWLEVEPCARRSVEKGRLPSDERLFVNGLSAITAFMAREGIDSPDIGLKRFW
jgi:hypothetical protein